MASDVTCDILCQRKVEYLCELTSEQAEHLCDMTSELAECEESRTINHLLKPLVSNISMTWPVSWQSRTMNHLLLPVFKLWLIKAFNPPRWRFVSPHWWAELQIYVQQAGVEDCNKVRSLTKNTSLSLGALVQSCNSARAREHRSRKGFIKSAEGFDGNINFTI